MRNSLRQPSKDAEHKEESRVELRSIADGDETSRLSETWKENHIENKSTPNTELFSPFNTAHFSQANSAAKQQPFQGKFFSTQSQFRTHEIKSSQVSKNVSVESKNSLFNGDSPLNRRNMTETKSNNFSQLSDGEELSRNNFETNDLGRPPQAFQRKFNPYSTNTDFSSVSKKKKTSLGKIKLQTNTPNLKIDPLSVINSPGAFSAQGPVIFKFWPSNKKLNTLPSVNSDTTDAKDTDSIIESIDSHLIE